MSQRSQFHILQNGALEIGLSFLRNRNLERPDTLRIGRHDDTAGTRFGRFIYLSIHQDFDEILIVARIGIDVQPGRIRLADQVRLTGVRSIRAKPPLYSNTMPSSGTSPPL